MFQKYANEDEEQIMYFFDIQQICEHLIETIEIIKHLHDFFGNFFGQHL